MRFTQVKSVKPVISICAVRTGSGKSQTTRRVSDDPAQHGLQGRGFVRHPMPYGDLVKQKVQGFETYADSDKHECTIEETRGMTTASGYGGSSTRWIMSLSCARPSRKSTSC